MWPVVLGGGAALAAIYAGTTRRRSIDAAEVLDTYDVGVTMDPYGEWNAVSELVTESLGWPYYWGRGGPSTPWSNGPQGVDCSGYAQMVLVQLGALDSSAPDRKAHELADACDKVEVGQQRPGDLALYGGATHVMMVCGAPGADGHSPVAGASGGGEADHGDNPDARVKLYSSALYWSSGFVCYMRLKE